MARGRSKKRQRRPSEAIVTTKAERVDSPPRGDFAFFRGRYQRVPVIDTMLKRNQLSEQEYRALAFYRDQASLAARTPIRSCLNDNQGGGGDIPISAAITSAILTTARIERDLGQLRPIAQAIAIEDKTLTEWCVEQYGGRERYGAKGEFVAVVPVREKERMKIAGLEIKMAAHRITA